jgi:gliding motility-associated-like protein
VADTTIQLAAGPDTALCSPAAIQLFANAVGTPGPIALTCGTNARVCSAANATIFTIGTNGGVSTSTSPFKAQEQEGRVQILLRASELNAVGLTKGTIRSIQFNVATKNSTTAFNQFTIRMGCTNATTVNNTFVAGLAQVFNPKPVNTVANWNSFVLDNSYDWDGISNLLIEICFTNTGNNNNDIIAYTQTTYNSVVADAQSFVFTGGCNLNIAPTTSSFRPDIRMAVCPPPPGQFTYTWTPTTGLSNPNISNPVSTATSTIGYLVTVSDGSCIATDSVTIQYYNGYLTNIAGNNVGCSGAADGNLVAAPSGGVPPYTFNWSTGQNTIGQLTDTVFNLPAGNYFLTVTDANGCIQIDPYTLTVPAALVINATGNNVTCFAYNDGIATVSAVGGTSPYSYLWSNGITDSSITNIGGGTFDVTVTDASGCFEIASVNIIEPAGVDYNTTTTIVSCFEGTDGTATVNITGGGTMPYNILWNNGLQENNINTSTNNNLTAGYIGFQIIDASGCFSIDSIFVDERDSFNIVAFSFQDASCYNTTDGIAIANVSTDTVNYQYSWITPPLVNNAFAGSRPQGINTVQVTDTSGCVQFAEVFIGSPPQIELRNYFVSPTCYNGNNGNISVEVTNGGVAPFSYLWNTSETDSFIENLVAGEYIVTVTDANGCFEFDTIVLQNPDSFLVETIISNVSCYGGSDGVISVIATGGTPPYDYSWLSGNSIVAPVSADRLENIAGTYSVIITDAQLCTDTLLELIISEPDLLQISYTTTNETCDEANDGSIIVSVTGGVTPYMYGIDNGNKTSGNTFTSLPPGDYTIEIADTNNCFADTSFTIIAGDVFSFSFNPDSLQIRLGDEIALPTVLPDDTTGFSFNWTPSTGLNCSDCANPVASPLLTTVYELTVINAEGCSVSEQIVVGVDNNLILFVPNAFTPNNDGINDLLKVFGISVKTINFNVFNRWGEKVYGVETDDLNQGWDGTYLGKMLPPDVFTYYLSAIFDDGQTKQLKGSVTLVR